MDVLNKIPIDVIIRKCLRDSKRRSEILSDDHSDSKSVKKILQINVDKPIYDEATNRKKRAIEFQILRDGNESNEQKIINKNGYRMLFYFGVEGIFYTDRNGIVIEHINDIGYEAKYRNDQFTIVSCLQCISDNNIYIDDVIYLRGNRYSELFKYERITKFKNIQGIDAQFSIIKNLVPSNILDTRITVFNHNDNETSARIQDEMSVEHRVRYFLKSNGVQLNRFNYEYLSSYHMVNVPIKDTHSLFVHKKGHDVLIYQGHDGFFWFNENLDMKPLMSDRDVNTIEPEKHNLLLCTWVPKEKTFYVIDGFMINGNKIDEKSHRDRMTLIKENWLNRTVNSKNKYFEIKMLQEIRVEELKTTYSDIRTISMIENSKSLLFTPRNRIIVWEDPSDVRIVMRLVIEKGSQSSEMTLRVKSNDKEVVFCGYFDMKKELSINGKSDMMVSCVYHHNRRLFCKKNMCWIYGIWSIIDEVKGEPLDDVKFIWKKVNIKRESIDIKSVIMKLEEEEWDDVVL